MSTKRFERDNDDNPPLAVGSGQDDAVNSQTNAQSPDAEIGPETWISLCARAAVEQDPKKLLDLVIEINRLLDARRKGLATGSDETSRNK